MAPGAIRQPAGMEVWIDGYVIPKAFRGCNQGVKLNLLHGPIAILATLDLTDCVENFFVRIGRECLCNLRKPFEYRERLDGIHRLQNVPDVPDGALDRSPSIRERQHAHRLGE